MKKCDKCPEEATWGFSTSTAEKPEGLAGGMRLYCQQHALETQTMIQHTNPMTLLMRQNLLSRLRPLTDFDDLGCRVLALEGEML